MESWLALTAGILTTASFIPQVSRAYGWLTGQLIIVVANGVTLGLALSLLFLKLRWG